MPLLQFSDTSLHICQQNIQIVFYKVFVDWDVKVQELADTCSRKSFIMVSDLEYCIGRFHPFIGHEDP
jgi:hypothetical protein